MRSSGSPTNCLASTYRCRAAAGSRGASHGNRRPAKFPRKRFPGRDRDLVLVSARDVCHGNNSRLQPYVLWPRWLGLAYRTAVFSLRGHSRSYKMHYWLGGNSSLVPTLLHNYHSYVHRPFGAAVVGGQRLNPKYFWAYGFSVDVVDADGVAASVVLLHMSAAAAPRLYPRTSPIGSRSVPHSAFTLQKHAVMEK